MKVLLFGASGAIGSAIAGELVDRGHDVLAATRQSSATSGLAHATVTADATDPDSVALAAAGQDAIISAIGPQRGSDGDPTILVEAAHALVAGARAAAVPRVIVVGGAGSLEVTPGQRLVDSPDFPDAWKGTALAHAAALDVFRVVDDLDWTYVSPAALITAGERTGHYRRGGDQLLTDDTGASRITQADFAIAIVDELDQGTAIRQRITVAH